jgi:RNA polymerase sigma-70 factor (ECF subfamily)
VFSACWHDDYAHGTGADQSPTAFLRFSSPPGDPVTGKMRKADMMQLDPITDVRERSTGRGRTGPSKIARADRKRNEPLNMSEGDEASAPPPGAQEPGMDEATIWLIAVRDRRDREAFVRLFDFYAPRLRAMLARMNCTGAAADDVIQDGMLRVWQKAHQFDPAQASASAWIYRIVRNRHIDIVRRDARPMPEALKVEGPPEPDPGEAIALQAEAARLRAALADLPPEQRRMVEMAYMGELSHREISDETGLPLGTVKSRIRLALERLRHSLKDLRQT